MLELSLPWWEFIARGAIVYGALMVMVRVSGKRTVGQFTPFDLLVVMLLSESVSNSLSGGDNSLVGGLLIAATLIALNMSVGYVASRSRRAEDAIDGKPVLIARDGEVFHDLLRRHRLGQGDWDKALREADVELHELKCAFLETDGTISVLKRSE